MILTLSGDKQTEAMGTYDPSAVNYAPDTPQVDDDARRRSRKRTIVLSLIVFIFIVALTLAAILVYFFVFTTNLNNVTQFSHPLPASSDPTAQQDVTADPNENVVEYHVAQNGEDSWIVDDFNRDIKVMKVSTSSGYVCYITPLNRSSAVEPDLVIPPINSDVNSSSSLMYTASQVPVSDSSFLGQTAASLCSGVSVYWIYPSCGDNQQQISPSSVQTLSTTSSPLSRRKKRGYVGTYNGLPCYCGCYICYCCCSATYSYTIIGGALKCYFACPTIGYSSGACGTFVYYRSTVLY